MFRSAYARQALLFNFSTDAISESQTIDLDYVKYFNYLMFPYRVCIFIMPGCDSAKIKISPHRLNYFENKETN